MRLCSFDEINRPTRRSPHFDQCSQFFHTIIGGMSCSIDEVNRIDADFFIDEDNGWTVYTEDDGLSAQIEYMVLVTETGIEVLTK
jgi:hypothetical protein